LPIPQQMIDVLNDLGVTINEEELDPDLMKVL
jgi:hypothetical protein